LTFESTFFKSPTPDAHLPKALADLTERLAQPFFKRRLKLFINRSPHFFKLFLILLLQGIEALFNSISYTFQPW